MTVVRKRADRPVRSNHIHDVPRRGHGGLASERGTSGSEREGGRLDTNRTCLLLLLLSLSQSLDRIQVHFNLRVDVDCLLMG